MAEEAEEYETFDLTASSALQLASETLMVAQEKAEMLNDTESLMKIAAGWMELHEYLVGNEREEKKQPLGFTGGLRGNNDGTVTDAHDDDTEFVAEQPDED